MINFKNFHGSLTAVVRAQNNTTKTANITDTIFDKTYLALTSDGVVVVAVVVVVVVVVVVETKEIWDLNSDFRINLDPDVRRICPKIVDALSRRPQPCRQVWHKSALDCMRIENT